MEPRYRYIIISVLLCLCLSGCTTTADRIYTVCECDDTSSKVYNMNNVVWQVSDTTHTFNHTVVDTHLREPVLLAHTRDGSCSYSKTDLPNKYKMSYFDMQRYLKKLSYDSGYSVYVQHADAHHLRYQVHTDNYSLRCLFDYPDTFRVYAINNSQKIIAPPYLIE